MERARGLADRGPDPPLPRRDRMACPRQCVSDTGGGGMTRHIALALLLAASTVQAFPSDGESDYSPKEVRTLMYAYAKCVVGREPRRASEALLANIDNATFIKYYGRLIIGECLVRETHVASRMTFKGDLYRYALADALVKRELATHPVPDLSAVPRLSHREPGPEPRPFNAKGKKLSAREYDEALKNYRQNVTFSFLSKYGECVVRAAPAESRALLATVPDSVEETSRFGALQPALATCMPEGHTVRFGRVALRGSLAINYYRLAHAARAAGTGTAG